MVDLRGRPRHPGGPPARRLEALRRTNLQVRRAPVPSVATADTHVDVRVRRQTQRGANEPAPRFSDGQSRTHNLWRLITSPGQDVGQGQNGLSAGDVRTQEHGPRKRERSDTLYTHSSPGKTRHVGPKRRSYGSRLEERSPGNVEDVSGGDVGDGSGWCHPLGEADLRDAQLQSDDHVEGPGAVTTGAGGRARVVRRGGRGLADARLRHGELEQSAEIRCQNAHEQKQRQPHVQPPLYHPGDRPRAGPLQAPQQPTRLDTDRFRWSNAIVLISQKIDFAWLSAVGIALLAAAVPAFGQAAGAAEDHQPATRLSGYMEFHYNKPELADGRLDFHRFVLLVTHEFSPRIRFVGELELEHALVEGLEEAGELELEQAYVDFLLSRGFNIRAGMLLMPVGILNERHEPPVFYGVERTFVDTVIVPTTWFEVGAGVHGEVGRGWRYRLFVTSPLNAVEFSAEEGLRGGRQRGAETNIGRAALTGRAEYVGLRGLTTGISFWTGKSGFELRPRFDVPVSSGGSRRALHPRPARTARPGRLRGHRQRRRAERHHRPHDRRRPEYRAGAAGRLCGSGLSHPRGPPLGRCRRVRRYENFDTQFRMPAGARADSRPRPRCVGRGGNLLARARHRGEGRLRHSAEPEHRDHGTQRVQRRSGMVVLMRRIVLGIVAAAAATSVMGLCGARASRPSPAVQKVEVTAERFAFQPSEIRTTVGTTLEVVLTSDDTTHGFRIKGEGVNVQIPKRGRGTITRDLHAQQAGRYTFECSRICGAGHGFMRGTIVVVERQADDK